MASTDKIVFSSSNSLPSIQNVNNASVSFIQNTTYNYGIRVSSEQYDNTISITDNMYINAYITIIATQDIILSATTPTIFAFIGQWDLGNYITPIVSNFDTELSSIIAIIRLPNNYNSFYITVLLNVSADDNGKISYLTLDIYIDSESISTPTRIPMSSLNTIFKYGLSLNHVSLYNITNMGELVGFG